MIFRGQKLIFGLRFELFRTFLFPKTLYNFKQRFFLIVYV